MQLSQGVEKANEPLVAGTHSTVALLKLHELSFRKRKRRFAHLEHRFWLDAMVLKVCTTGEEVSCAPQAPVLAEIPGGGRVSAPRDWLPAASFLPLQGKQVHTALHVQKKPIVEQAL